MEISSVHSANFTGSEDRKTTTGSMVKGFIVGDLVAGTAALAKQPIGKSALSYMKKCSALSADEFKAVEKAAEKMRFFTGLKGKGVEIIKATDQNMGQIKGMLVKTLNRNFVGRLIPKPIKGFVAETFAKIFKDGKNAAFLPKVNKIVTPENKLALAAFHEMGHALNHNFSKIGKFLQKSRMLAVLAAPIALIALIKNKKSDGEKTQGFWDKTTTFIKENAGKLTFLTFVPTLIEEAMASIKGQKFAKVLLSPELAKKVAKTNIAGWLSYATVATLTGVGIYLGTKVRDKIVHKQNA